MGYYKNFQNGTALTAEVMNDFIMEQTIARFANAAERNTAIPAPEVGQHCYLTSTNQTLRYEGTTAGWVELISAGLSGLTQRATVVCTSTTRPAHAAGRHIYETDTKRTYSSDGSAWTHIGGGTPVRVAPTFWGGWQNYGSEFETVGFAKVNGVVLLSGLLQNVPALSANTTYQFIGPGGIPAGYRPATQILAAGNQGNGLAVRIDILPNGSASIVIGNAVQAMFYFGLNTTYLAA